MRDFTTITRHVIFLWNFRDGWYHLKLEAEILKIQSYGTNFLPFFLVSRPLISSYQMVRGCLVVNILFHFFRDAWLVSSSSFDRVKWVNHKPLRLKSFPVKATGEWEFFLRRPKYVLDDNNFLFCRTKRSCFSLWTGTGRAGNQNREPVHRLLVFSLLLPIRSKSQSNLELLTFFLSIWRACQTRSAKPCYQA